MNAASIIEKTAVAHAKARKSYPFTNGEYQFFLKHGGLPEAFDERSDPKEQAKRAFAYMGATGGALAAVGGLAGGPVGAAIGLGFGTTIGMVLDKLRHQSLIHKARAMRDEAVLRGDIIAGMPAREVTFDDTVAWHVQNPTVAERLANLQAASMPAFSTDADATRHVSGNSSGSSGRQTRSEELASLTEGSRNREPASKLAEVDQGLFAVKSRNTLSL